MTAKLTEGVLAEAYAKIRRNLITRIDPSVHAATYAGDHDYQYAEPEFTGKYIDICEQFDKAEPDPYFRNALDMVLSSILKNQKPNGDLSALKNEEGWFTVWNNAFTLYGMVIAYQSSRDRAVLASAMKCADRIVERFYTNMPKFLDTVNEGSEHLVFILPLTMLWEITGKKTYLTFLESLFAYLPHTDMNLVYFKSVKELRSQKGIEMLVAYLGVLRYGKATCQNDYIDAAKRYFKEIAETQIGPTGNGTLFEKWTEEGNAPAFHSFDEKPNENCVAVGFMELALALFEERPEAYYLDCVENTLFNHVLGALDKEGRDFGYYQSNFGVKVPATPKDMYQCCRYRGYTFFSHLPDMLYFFDGKRLIPRLYASSVFSAEGLTVVQKTDFPRSGKVLFDFDSTFPFTLSLRLPYYAAAQALTVDGKPVYRKPAEGFVTFTVPEGKCRVEYEMIWDVVRTDAVIDGKPYASFRYGPLLLATDENTGAVLTEDRTGCFTAEENPAPYFCRLSRGDLTLVDYANAGNVHPGQDRFSVWLPRTAERKTVLCVGDSLTEGDFGEVRGVGVTYPQNYPLFLSRMLDVKTVNAGKCGYTAKQIKEWYEQGGFSLDNADFVLLMLGTNGGLSMNGDDSQLTAYQDIARTFARKAGKENVVLLTPPNATSVPGKVNFGCLPNVENAANEIRRFAAEEGFHLIDLLKDTRLTPANEDKYQPGDGLHFVALGYYVMAERIAA
ncbi:MAG: glycoside hydrolase family 127 protein, partial [Clostridia bacterium]|nr:glycoside hydrolase family 127 protein [Clostridia bacterium]